MVESKQGDARIYIVSSIFFACIVAGGTFLCLYIFRPESESSHWYPVAGIILVGIPWIFWIGTYIYRCCSYCCCQSYGGGNVSKVYSSSTKSQSYASAEGPAAARSTDSSENEDSPLKSSPNGDHRRVHFGEVVVMGSSKHSQNDDDGGGDQSPHKDHAKGYPETYHEEGKENTNGSIASDKDYVSVACSNGKAQLILSVST